MDALENIPPAQPEKKLPKKTSKFKKAIRWIEFFVLVFLVLFCWWKFYYNYSDGYRSGLLQKLSHKGNIFKTYEGELIQRSVVTTANVGIASEKFYFSVANDSIAKVMQEYEGKNVKLHYEQKNGILPWRGDTEYIINDVRLEEKDTP